MYQLVSEAGNMLLGVQFLCRVVLRMLNVAGYQLEWKRVRDWGDGLMWGGVDVMV